MKVKFCGIAITIENRRRILGHCHTCHWWDLQYTTPGETRGHCHRLAPMTDHIGRTLWPRTNAKQSCGQFQIKSPEAKGGVK